MKNKQFILTFVLCVIAPFSVHAQQGLNKPAQTTNTTTPLLKTEWQDQRLELMTNLRAELMGAYAQAWVTHYYASARNDKSCRKQFQQAMALADEAAGTYFHMTEFSRMWPKEWQLARVQKARELIEKANAMSQSCPGYPESVDFRPAVREEKMRIYALKYRRPIADVIKPVDEP